MMSTRWKSWWWSALIVVVGAAGGFWLTVADPAAGQVGGHEQDEERGPHGGTLLRAGEFALEILIYERGVPPELRVYGYRDGEPLPPDAYSVGITLERLDGIDRFEFAAESGFRRGRGVVREPHSFDVIVRAEHSGRPFEWRYQSHEGRTRIDSAMAIASGIRTEAAGPATLVETVRLTGTVQPDPARLAEVRARFPGVVRSVHTAIGDRVAAGDVLATVESNESLERFDVTAPIDGVVLSRNLQVGQITAEEPLFQVVDTSEVWVQLDVFGRQTARVREGQTVRVETADGRSVSGRIDWLTPLVTRGSQSVQARVVLSNPEGRWRPGRFVAAEVIVDSYRVPLAVHREALQSFREHDVVFGRFGDLYEVRMVELGRGDDDFVEVLGGLRPGQEYVTANSYLVKADIEKSGASHDH